MRKHIRQLRDKIIADIWEQKKAEWTMSDLAFLFNLSLAQVYRIIKVVNKSKSKL